MARISRNRRFQVIKVDILRPAFSIDVTLIRDPILLNYVSVKSNVNIYIEPVHSEIVRDRQVGSISVDRMVGFLDDAIQPNDVVRENANSKNGNTIVYWNVTGVWDYTRFGFHIRVDLDKMNYQRT